MKPATYLVALVAVALVVASATPVAAFYDAKDDVVVLTPENFDTEVTNNKDDIWIVEFYAPWCGHCKMLTPEWKKAATALKDIVRIGAVDAEKHAELGSKFGVQGFPTIKVFGAHLKKEKEYDGGRKAEDIVAYAIDEIEHLTKHRSTKLE